MTLDATKTCLQCDAERLEGRFHCHGCIDAMERRRQPRPTLRQLMEQRWAEPRMTNPRRRARYEHSGRPKP